MRTLEITAVREAAEGVAQIRQLFEDELRGNDSHYHPIDIDRVRREEWQILRFLHRAPSIESAFERMIDTLRWKRQFGVHDTRDRDFAREFYEINGLEIVGRDPATGTLIVWNTSKYSRDFAELKPYIRRFLVHEIEHLDRTAGPAGMIVVSDAKHVGLFSVDIDVTRYANDIVMRHYPCSVRQSFVINLSAWLDPIWKIVINFLNAELRESTRVVRCQQLIDYLDSRFVPVAYGGTRRDSAIRVPADAPSYNDMPQMPLTDAQKRRYKALLDKLKD